MELANGITIFELVPPPVYQRSTRNQNHVQTCVIWWVIAAVIVSTLIGRSIHPRFCLFVKDTYLYMMHLKTLPMSINSAVVAVRIILAETDQWIGNTSSCDRGLTMNKSLIVIESFSVVLILNVWDSNLFELSSCLETRTKNGRRWLHPLLMMIGVERRSSRKLVQPKMNPLLKLNKMLCTFFYKNLSVF